MQACNDRTCLWPSTVRASLPVPVAPAGANPEPTDDPMFEEAASTSITSTLMPILRQHGFLIAGGVLVLETALVLRLASAYGTPEEQD